MKRVVLSAVAIFALVLVASSSSDAVDKPALVVGPGNGVMVDSDVADPPCGYTFIRTDGTYETGFAYDYGGVQEPDFGSFAECQETGALEVCALFFDFTTVESYQDEQRMDVFVWEDEAGIPGTVLSMVADVDPGTVAIWPEISRHVVPIQYYPQGSWWCGFWGSWAWGFTGWFIAADQDGPGEGACPMTKISPGMIGYEPGWQNVSVIWGPTAALGIGFLGHSMLPAEVEEDDPADLSGSWGRLKALYR